MPRWIAGLLTIGLLGPAGAAAQTVRETQVHQGPVGALAFLSSNCLLTGGFDQQLCTVAAGSSKKVRTVQRSPAKVMALAVSVDGSQWAAGHVDGAVHLGKSTTRLEQCASCVYGLTFSPDGRWLLACSEDGVVRVWDLHAGHVCQTLHVNSSALYALALSPDGTTVATAGLEGEIHVLDLVSGAHLATLHGHADAIYSLSYSPDGQRLASASGDGTVRLWDLRSHKEAACLRGHASAIYHVSFDAGGARLLSAATNGLAVIWDAATGAALHSHRFSGKIMCASWAPQGERIAVGTDGGVCFVLDLPGHWRD